MLEDPAKSPLKSVGVIGGTGALVTTALNAFGVEIVPGSHADAIVTIIFIAVSLYGRLRATQKLTTAPPDVPSAPG